VTRDEMKSGLGIAICVAAVVAMVWADYRPSHVPFFLQLAMILALAIATIVAVARFFPKGDE